MKDQTRKNIDPTQLVTIATDGSHKDGWEGDVVVVQGQVGNKLVAQTGLNDSRWKSRAHGFLLP